MSAQSPMTWFSDDIPVAAVMYVHGRLRHYAILRGFLSRLAASAVDRAAVIVEYINELYYRTDLKPTYYADKTEFIRWLHAVAYRECLRLVLDPEPCERFLSKLPDR